jgi:hypothetical protein
MAIHQAIDRGLITRNQLIQDARGRSRRVASLVEGALQEFSV